MRTGSNDPRPPLADRIGLFFSVGRVVDGLWIGTIDVNDEPVLRRVEEALALIKAYDKRRYDRLIKDLERVWVRMLPDELGNFSRALRACVLDTRFVLAETTSLEILAVVIVHEATHARLRHCGIGYDEQMRHRVEAVCFRRELAFARKLPKGQPVREWIENSLEQVPAFDWTDAARAKRDLEGNVEILHHLGAPKWLVRMMLAVRAWRTRGSKSSPS